MSLNFYHKALTAGRRIYTKYWYPKTSVLTFESDPDRAGDRIYELLASGKPCMIARYGANELTTVFNYLGITEHRGDAWGYMTRKNGPWWWNKHILMQMKHAAGFFPIDNEHLYRFSEMMLEDSQQVDILGSWLNEEIAVSHLLKNAYKVALPCLEPWLAKKPWSRALEGRKVLVVHPFDELIRRQYEKRRLLFSDNVLPTFKELHVIKAVQSYGNNSESCGYNDWFSALHWMEQEMDKSEYDVCILGCGAYGFPLAAYAKRQGKQAIHLGGVSQLLFGITGHRWLNPMHGVERWGLPKGFYVNLMNEHWIRPDATTKPKDSDKVEGNCYW